MHMCSDTHASAFIMTSEKPSKYSLLGWDFSKVGRNYHETQEITVNPLGDA